MVDSWRSKGQMHGEDGNWNYRTDMIPRCGGNVLGLGLRVEKVENWAAEPRGLVNLY
jgi:hypothetical protein